MHPSRGSGCRGRGNSTAPQNHSQSASRNDHRGGHERNFQVGNSGEHGRGRGGFSGRRGSNPGHRGVLPLRVAHNIEEGGGMRNDRNMRRNERFPEGGNGNGRRDNPPQALTYGRLKLWAEMEDAGKLVLFMSSERQQIETFLKQDSIKTDWMTLFVKAVNHAITAQHQKESIKQLLDSLCKNRFFEHFTNYVEEKRLFGLLWADGEDFYRSLLNIMEEVLNKLPLQQYTIKCVSGASMLLNAAASLVSIQNNQTLLDALTDFSKRAKDVHIVVKDQSNKPKGAQLYGNNESEKPSDNFLDLSVVPSIQDLSVDAKPFIRRAKIVGEYDDVEHYLDVQFRLMRQDFIHPLKEGLIQFKKNGCGKNNICSDLRLYYDVHIVGTVFKDGIDHILQFDVSKLKNIKWEFSKRLIFGSLLCLSKDNFETVLFATVANRDAKDLAKGTVNVSFKTELDEIFNSTSSDTYIMAETTTYFEAYCHVLEGLKEMSKTLPLQDYIIRCRKDIKPPRYLLLSGGITVLPKYNLSALMKNKEDREVAVLTTVSWPQSDVMCLNKSQRDAAMLALTKELAVIQGPPGTGKTYVGLKVIEVLLDNMEIISGSNKNKKGPILVVCYTNHALDQFLEGVMEFCPSGIVRVGGKSKSEKLEQFNIKNLKQKLRREKLYSNVSVRKSVGECLKELHIVSDEISNLNLIMNSLETDVLHETHLEDVIKPTQFESLTTQRSQPRQNKSILSIWLNASTNTSQSVVRKMIQKRLTWLVLQCREVSTNTSLTPDMGIFERISFYHMYLGEYIFNLQQELSFYLSQQFYDAMVQSRIQEIHKWLEFVQTQILPDEELERVMPDYVISKINSFLSSNGRSGSLPFGAIVETWLLGLHKELHSQLDDVQVMSGDVLDIDTFDDDDATRQVQNDRFIDDDDEYDGHKNYNARSKAAMDNISSVIQRAHMLGIREDLLMADEYADADDDDGWTTVKHTKPMSFMKLQKKLKTTKPMTEEMESSLGNVWDLDLNQRFALYNLWIKRYKKTLTSKMRELVDRYTSACERKKEANTEEVLFILRNAEVVGMTTTGAARHRAVLQALGCRIIIVEEAAEVLEAHIITALNKNCKHLILIGDHQQLRPSPTVYVLAKEFGLEISFFERLIKNDVRHVLLEEQHRMRPEISKIMCHIYPSLQDHSSVKSYDHVRGVSKNIFFIQHEHKETHVDDSRSKANIHEAQFLVALCQYLLNQGYSESEITILATYAGQVLAVKKVMKDVKFSHRVRVTAVDNFQGEENEIILLSLVRSNTENSVGFLKVDNRICVALSRARKGLFVTGNFDLLASQSKLWTNIIGTMKEESAIGGGLPVACQNHPDFQQIMTCAEDFKKCPDGGCGRNCEYRLTCGHVCGRKCHGYDNEHKNYQCRKDCTKKCEDGHPCQRKCYQDCGSCMVRVEKQIPICGHTDKVPCSVPAIKADCSHSCNFLLDCEHTCTGKCGQCRKSKTHAKCVVPVSYTWPCGHSAVVPCHKNPESFPCQKKCGADLECGHKCTGECSDCLQQFVHVACGKKCEKKLPCGHTCPSFCGVPCLPCTEVCPAECHHGSCKKANGSNLCSHACTPCKEKCKIVCFHKACTKLCSDDCDKEPCSQTCKNKMKNCKHPCSGLCGEICVCATCEQITVLQDKNNTSKVSSHDNEKNSTTNDNSLRSNSGFNKGQATPAENQVQSKDGTIRPIIKVPTCKHVFYVDELDNYVQNFDPDGTSYITCPVCPKLILKCIRYEYVNKERQRKRDNLKRKLKLATDVSGHQKRNLQKSQAVLEDSIFLTGFRSINIDEVKNVVEAQAVSFQLKCAFMLSEISSLIENNPESAQHLRLLKDTILAIKNRVTSQQKSEFTRELLRRFWLFYVIYLESLSLRHDIDLPAAMSATVRETKEGLSQLKPEDDLLERAQLLSDILRRRIAEMTTEQTVQARCLLLEQASQRAVKVMRSRDEDILCDLIGGGKELEASSRVMNLIIPKVPDRRLGGRGRRMPVVNTTRKPFRDYKHRDEVEDEGVDLDDLLKMITNDRAERLFESRGRRGSATNSRADDLYRSSERRRLPTNSRAQGLLHSDTEDTTSDSS